MSSLFMPQEQEERNLLLKRSANGDVTGDVLIVALCKELYLLEDFDFEPVPLNRYTYDVTALGYCLGNLYVGERKEIHLNLSETIMQNRDGDIHGFCDVDDVMYDCGPYGVYKTWGADYLSCQPYNAVAYHDRLLASWWNDIREAEYDDLYTNTSVEANILSMCSVNSDLYYGGSLRQDGFVARMNNHEVVGKRDSVCREVFTFGTQKLIPNNLYDACDDGKIFNTTTGEKVYDFEKQLSALTVFPKAYLDSLEVEL